MDTVRCSKCSSNLDYLGGLGNMLAPGASIIGSSSALKGLEQWRGNLCMRCRAVYCGRCMELGGPTPCPKCGEPTVPAQRRNLEAIGKL
jgi:hypothetical protein